MKYLSFIIISCIVLYSCAGSKINQKKEAQNLIETSRAWAKSASPEIAFSFWADSATALFPHFPIVKGKENIGNLFNAISQKSRPIISWEPQEAYVSKSGEIGYLVLKGQWKTTDSLGNISIAYTKAVNIWKKQNGQWKCAVDIFNDNPAGK